MYDNLLHYDFELSHSQCYIWLFTKFCKIGEVLASTVCAKMIFEIWKTLIAWPFDQNIWSELQNNPTSYDKYL